MSDIAVESNVKLWCQFARPDTAKFKLSSYSSFSTDSLMKNKKKAKTNELRNDQDLEKLLYLLSITLTCTLSQRMPQQYHYCNCEYANLNFTIS